MFKILNVARSCHIDKQIHVQVQPDVSEKHNDKGKIEIILKLFIYSFVQQIFFEPVLHNKHCVRHWT